MSIIIDAISTGAEVIAIPLLRDRRQGWCHMQTAGIKIKKVKRGQSN
ncbi:hypothetical protein NIASO_07520 [Niabella soli DSM 19437]|uniref:Uncharacterized protein n=1 Tax=Niabella soli DSM 19437 TaxID=929713 RepID=W0F329_9BACT|nr:hypothetical protein NIASO_07520 [Niabella soli DSM 19437]